MLKKLKNKENGFAASDGLIAILIIALFTGLIATLTYNIYLSNVSVKRVETATGYITKVFEQIDKMYYDDVSISKLEEYLNNNSQIFEIETEKPVNQINIFLNTEETPKTTLGDTTNPRYTIDITIKDYNRTEGNLNKLDLIKEVIMKVKYKLGNKDQEIEMKRIKTRENLVTPNAPDISLLNVEGNIYPIKFINNKWKVCDERDATWYDYTAGYWATVIVTSNFYNIDDDIDINSSDIEIYKWIPRFAYNSTNASIKFLYKNTNNYVENTDSGYASLNAISADDEVVGNFINGEENLLGIWVSKVEATTNNAYSILNSIYPVK